MKFYHATVFSNYPDIAASGIRRSIDGVVYLCKKPEDSLKFVAVRGIKDVLMCEVDIPSSWTIETFDHCEAFFKCRCFGSTKDIPTSRITNYSRYK